MPLASYKILTRGSF